MSPSLDPVETAVSSWVTLSGHVQRINYTELVLHVFPAYFSTLSQISVD